MALPPKSLLLLLRTIAHHCFYKSVTATPADILAIFAGGGISDSTLAFKSAASLEGLIALAARDDLSAVEVAAKCLTLGFEMPELSRETVSGWWRDNRSTIRAHLQAVHRWQPQLIGLDWTASMLTATGSATLIDPEPSLLLQFSVASPGTANVVSFEVEADQVALSSLLRGLQSTLAAVQLRG